MNPLLRNCLLGALIATAAIFLSVQAALAMVVRPVVLDLETIGRGSSKVISVVNDQDRDLTVELSFLTATIALDGRIVPGIESEDISIFPSQALIKPGQTQSFRVQYDASKDELASRHFIISVNQLPVTAPEGQNSVQIVYSFAVITNISLTGQAPILSVNSATIGKTADGSPQARIAVSNSAATFGYLSDGRLRVVQKDESGREIYARTYESEEIRQEIGLGLVPANGGREITIPGKLPSAEGSVTVTYTPPSRRR